MGEQEKRNAAEAMLENKRGTWSRISSSQTFYLLVILIAIWIIGAIITPAMFTANNWTTVLRNASYGGVAALAEGLILLSGEFDMSIGSIASLAAITSGMVYTATANEVLTLFVGIFTAMGCGLLNGFICVKLKISNLIGTLGTMTIYQGLAQLIGKNRVINKTTASVIYNWFGKTNIGFIPVGFLILVALALILTFVLKKTGFGRKVYFVGANSNAAWHAGLEVSRIKILSYVFGGTMMVLVTFMVGGQIGALNAKLGSGYELSGIVIAVLGGVSLSGGIGSIAGIFAATMLFQFLLNLLLLTGMGTYVETVIKGILLVVIVLFSTVLERRRRVKAK